MNFVIEGVAVPKARPRFYNGHAVTPPKTKEFEATVKYSYLRESKECFEGELRVEIMFYMPIPKSATQRTQRKMRMGLIRPHTRPDIDNLIKAILDGLNGTAFKDDNQIVELSASEYYSEEPRTVVFIKEIEHDEQDTESQELSVGRS